MNKGALHRIVMGVCHALTSRRGDVIQWPRQHELQPLADKWQRKAGLPGVIGAIDGTYIKIPGTCDQNRDAYICRKGFPAMQLQVVCNKDLLFMDVHTGNVGSVHDSRMFRTCDLKRLLETAAGRLPQQYHLLGDSAYSMQDYLLVPFRDNGHLNAVQAAFNKAHSGTRVEVEHAIGLLKGKFRRLKDLDMTKLCEIPYVIFAACVLHNFIIIQNGVDEDDIDVSDEDDDEGRDGPDDEPLITGEQKRLAIAHTLV